MRKAAVITRFGGVNVFEIQELPSPEMGAKELRIQVAASGINFADIMMRLGLYPEAPKPPFIPGYEVAGRVIEVGSEVKKFRVGDRVTAGCKFGGYTSEIVADEDSVQLTPEGLSDIEAAAIPVNFLTAWLALEEMARVRAGDRVLIQSAAGGVGLAAVQLAAQRGAFVVGMIGQAHKSEIVLKMGASQTILNSDWEKSELSDGERYQIILDSRGGASLKRSYRQLAPSGRVVTFGVSDMVSARKSLWKVAKLFVGAPLFFPLSLMNENKGVYGLNVLKFMTPERSATMNRGFMEILSGFKTQKLHVVVGKTFPLEEVGAAHSYLQSGANIGKVILTYRT